MAESVPTPAAPAADVVSPASLVCWSDDKTVSLPVQPADQPVFDDPLQQAAAGGDKPVRLPVNPEVNAKLYFWRHGDLTRIDVDAIVNSTNETLSERNGLSERIMAAAGKEIYADVAALEGCRTGEAKMTSGGNLPARHIIHTVGPRFNQKYKTAAESALHNCYRGSLELVTDAGLTSIAFCVINSLRRGYPPEAGAHMALRTIRRFLERFGNKLDRVILCVTDDVDLRVYEGLLPVYFPRNAEEERYSAQQLPEDIGNEIGEPVQEERRIRIGETRTTSMLDRHVTMTGPSVFDGDLRKTGDDEEPIADEDELAHSVAASFGAMQGDHDASRREALSSARGGRANDSEDAQRRYARWLRRARNANLSHIAALNAIYQSGVDSLGRPVVCIAAKLYDMDKIDREQTLLYLIHFLDNIANKDYVVVYFNTDTTSANRPDPSFVRQVYAILDPKYRRNLKTLYIVHPTWWVRFIITIMNTFFMSDVRDKIRNVEQIRDLYDTVSASGIKVPDYVLQYDQKYFGASASNSTAAITDAFDKL